MISAIAKREPFTVVRDICGCILLCDAELQLNTIHKQLKTRGWENYGGMKPKIDTPLNGCFK